MPALGQFGRLTQGRVSVASFRIERVSTAFKDVFEAANALNMMAMKETAESVWAPRCTEVQRTAQEKHS